MQKNDTIDVVITGAAGGIGKELVTLLQSMPNVRITAFTRDKRTFDNRFGFLSNIYVSQFDFLMFNDKQLKKSMEHLDKIDILINNAGFLINKPFTEIVPIDIHKMVQVNLTATMLFTQACIPYLKKSDKAHIINISSMGGFQGSLKFPGLSVYSATKAAICAFTEAIAEEYKSDKIHCNAIALGATDTSMFNTAFPNQKAERSPNEVAAFIADFALNRRNLFNGKIIPLSATTP